MELLINVPTGRRSAYIKKVAATRYGPLAVCDCPGGQAIVHAATGTPLIVLPDPVAVREAINRLVDLDWGYTRRFGRVVFSPATSAAVGCC